MLNSNIEVRSLNEQVEPFISIGESQVCDSGMHTIQVILSHPSEDNPICFTGEAGLFDSDGLKYLAINDGIEKAIKYCLEKGYVSEPVKLFNFATALVVLQGGSKIARSGWNGKNQWLSISCPESKAVAAENFWSPHNAEFARSNGGTATVAPCITLKNAQDEIVMGWIPSSGDLFANDWMVAE